MVSNTFKKQYKILVVGANSAIAEACVSIYAQDKTQLTLVGRDLKKLEALAAKAKSLGACNVDCAPWNFENTDGLSELIQTLWTKANSFDHVLICHGILPPSDTSALNSAVLEKLICVNYTSIVVILQALERVFLKNTICNIGVIGSVAGDRGRKSNYLYGSTKAALSTYVDGLTHKYASSNVRLVTIKPGFVDTPMTSSFRKGFLWAKPEKVATSIVAALYWNHRGVLYVPSFWRQIMCIVRGLPNFIFWRTKL